MVAKKYFPEIDVLKGFAVFLVVLGHSTLSYARQNSMRMLPACGFLGLFPAYIYRFSSCFRASASL